MAGTYQDQVTGSQYVMGDAGWRPMTDQEVEIQGRSGIEQAGRSAGNSLKQLHGLSQQILGYAASGFTPGVGTENPFSRAMISKGEENFGEASQALDVGNSIRPQATATGEILANVALGMDGLLALGGGKAAVVQGARYEAKDSVARAAMALGERPVATAPKLTGEQLASIGDVASGFGGDSAGAAARGGMWQAFKKVPGMKSALEGLEEFIGTSRPLKADQVSILQSGRAEELGWQWLPGQANGNNVISDIIRSQPFMADALDPIMVSNAQNLSRRFAKALGVEGDDIGRDVLGRADVRLAQNFEDIAGSVGPAQVPSDLMAGVSKGLTVDERALFAVDDPARVYSGNELMEMRSHLNTLLAEKRAGGRNLAARETQQSIDKLDEIITAQMDPADVNFWRETQQRWRVRIAADRKGVIMDDGSVSLRTLNNSLKSVFDSEYKNRLFAPERLPADIRDLMDLTRIGRAFESNLGDSGTATRSAMGEIIKGNGMGFVKQRLGAKFITDVVLNQPIRAQGLPGEGVIADVLAGSL